MSAREVVSNIVLLAAGIACVVGTWTLIEVTRAMRSLRALSDDTRARLVPLLDKADVTVDAVNAELLRIDAIVTRVEDASERVSSASGTLSGIVNAPTELVSEMAGRVRKAWRDRRHTASGRPGAAHGTGAGESEDTSVADVDSQRETDPASLQEDDR